MTERMPDAQLDREIRAFLAWHEDDLGGAPSADEMTVRVHGRVRPGALVLLRTDHQRLVLALLVAALLSLLVVGAAFVGRPGPLPTSVENGWIAYSTQPGYRQAFETDWADGSDIYLVRMGSAPRIIVERGPDMKRNVCPQFSPDGSRLVYGELTGAAAALVVLDVRDDGSVVEWRRLALPGASVAAPCPRWSSDSTHIAYLESVETGVKAVDLNGLPVPPAEDDPSDDDFTASETDAPLLSPDGALRALCAEDTVLVGPADGSGDREVGTDCGYSIAAWSPDGSNLLLLSAGGRNASMQLLSVTGPRAAEYLWIAPYIPVNGVRSWPGRGDVSWQPVFE